MLHNGNIEVTNSKLGVLVDNIELVKPSDSDNTPSYTYITKTQLDGVSEVITLIAIDYLCGCL